jgi:hypothetical protein
VGGAQPERRLTALRASLRSGGVGSGPSRVAGCRALLAPLALPLALPALGPLRRLVGLRQLLGPLQDRYLPRLRRLLLAARGGARLRRHVAHGKSKQGAGAA